MSVGESQTITASSIRNGEQPDTENHPVSYLFSSSDESVLTVDENGVVTSVKEGTATITVALEQNTEITATAEITVTAEQIAAEFVFTPELPDSLKQLQQYQGYVSVRQGATVIAASVGMQLFGANGNASAAFDDSDNSLSIKCWKKHKSIFTFSKSPIGHTHI